MNNQNKDVIIVGSGLSAFGAIRAAIKTKARVTVIDIGNLLPSSLKDKVSEIDKENTGYVHKEIYRISTEEESTSLTGKNLPKKTVFGSKFFYQEDELSKGSELPFSEAKGGYSVAWGAAILPPSKDDLPNICFDYQELLNSIEMLGPEIGLPTYKDGLTNAFPNFTTSLDNSSPIKLSNSQKKLLNQLSQLEIQTDRQSCLVGQARVLTKNSGPTGCKYCGMCSFGCIYDSIFSSKNEIEKLVRENRIEYISSLRLISVEDFGEMARLNCINLVSGEEEVFACRVAFIAAGAVNSTKIALKSLGLEKEIIKFQKTGGFVRPYFSIKKLGLDWPNQNTQANVFMEIKDLSISKYWIHSQVSSPNEVVILGLGLLKDSFFQRILSPMRRFFLNHLVLVMTNVHSNEGPYYSISLSPNSKHAKFVGSLEIPKSYTSIEKRIERLIRRKLLSIGMISIPFAKKGVGNGPGYHIGSSMPMGGEGSISTNELGQLRSHKNIFFIDTSVLPCIPATTIGLFAMSNAHRITSKVLQSRDFE